MALSLSACGSEDAPVTPVTPVTPVVPEGVAYTLTSGDDSIAALGGADTVAGTISVSSTGIVTSTLGAADIINGGDGADSMTLRVTTSAVEATAAVAQINTYTVGSNAPGTATLTIGGTSYTVVTAGVPELDVLALAAAIDAHFGEDVTVISGDNDEILAVTAPTAGTALESIVFGPVVDGEGASAAFAVTTVFTEPNAAAVAGTTPDLSNAVVVAAADVDSIESVIVHNTGGAVTLDASTYTGATNFTAKLSTGAVTFNDIGTADITIEGNDSVANGDVSFRSSDTASVTDALVINATGGVQQGTIESTSEHDDWSAVTINSSGGTETATTMANAFTAMILADDAADGFDTLTINASSSISTGAISGWDDAGADANTGAIIVTGDSTVDLGALDAAVESVTASASSGGVRFTASEQTDFVFVGSAGDDRVTTGAVLSTVASDAASIDAGAGGDDRLTVSASGHVTTTVGALYKGFEQVQVANGVALDMDHLAANNSIDTVLLTTGGQVNDMTAAQAANITVSAGGNAPVLTVKGGTTVGQVDTVAITASDALAAVNTISLGAISIAGVEKLELTATDNVTVTALTSATSLDGITGSGAGVISITSGASLGNTNQTINLTAATGDNIVNIAGATAAVAVTTGAGADTITLGVNVAHTVNAGGGLDIISIGLSNSADVISTATTSADADRIVSFESTANDFDYNGALSNGTGTVTSGIAATEITTATTIAAGLATGGAGDDIVFIASTAIAADALDAVEAAMTSTTINAAEAALVADGGILGGAIANLDDVLGTTDAALFVISTDSGSFAIRVTNTDTTVANTLTQDEIELVAVFDDASAALVAADII